MLGVVKVLWVLIGVFLGVFISGFLIVGKELFLWKEEIFEELYNWWIFIKEGLFLVSILVYFEKYDSCYFKVWEVSIFDFCDLE